MSGKAGRSLRILYHHRTQGRGAEGHHIVSIVEALRGLGHEVDLVSPPGIDPFALRDQAPVDKAQVETRGLQTLWKWVSKHLPDAAFELAEIGYNLPAYFRLRKALDQGRYDLVYERYAFYLIAGAICAKRKNIPLVLEANEVVGIPSRARPLVFTGLCNRFEAYLFRRCRRILAVSSYLCRMIVEKGGGIPDQIRVVPNAIDPQTLKTGPRNLRLQEELGITRRRVIGFAGWFDRWDRLDWMIQVFARLLATEPDICLLLIGDGPVLGQVRQECVRLGITEHVRMTGKIPRSEVQEYLKLLDIALLPHSNQFGSPVVLFEFFGLRIPVVAPRLPPMEDVITDGENGVLFPPLNLDACARAVAKLLQNPELATQVAHSAHQRLLEKHTWKHNAEQIYQNLP